MFKGWTVVDFIAAAIGLWIASGVAILGFAAFLHDIERRYGPDAEVYDFTEHARKRGRAA